MFLTTAMFEDRSEGLIAQVATALPSKARKKAALLELNFRRSELVK
jgi:hypothetical protein